MCSYDESRRKGYMSLEIAEKTLTQAAELGVTEVRFFLAGEPFFHPHLSELVAISKKRGLLTLIHTNATFMPEDRVEKVIDAGLDKISFSFDGESAEEYEAVRIGGKFDSTLQNITNFLNLKKQRGSKFPITTIQVIKMPSSRNPDIITDEFRGRFTGLPVDEFLLLKPFTWPGQEEKEFARKPGHRYFPCMIPWTSLSVGWDGRVLWCCGDLNGKGVLGDVNTSTLREIWNGGEIKRLRRGLHSGNLDDLPLCQNCEAKYHRHNPILSDIKDYLRQIKRMI